MSSAHMTLGKMMKSDISFSAAFASGSLAALYDSSAGVNGNRKTPEPPGAVR